MVKIKTQSNDNDIESQKKNRYLIPNLQKACQVLKFLSQHEEALTISKISEDLNIPYTSCLRILSTLEEEGLLKVENNKYLLGGASFLLGLSYQLLSYISYCRFWD